MDSIQPFRSSSIIIFFFKIVGQSGSGAHVKKPAHARAGLGSLIKLGLGTGWPVAHLYTLQVCKKGRDVGLAVKRLPSP